LFPRELGPFLGESTLLSREVALLFRDLGPFLEESKLLLEEAALLLGELFLVLVQIILQGISFVPLGNVFALRELHFAPWGTYIVP
jgi:hypothetical protein